VRDKPTERYIHVWLSRTSALPQKAHRFPRAPASHPGPLPGGGGRSGMHREDKPRAMRSELRLKSSAIRARCAALGSTPGVPSHGDPVGRASRVRAWIQHDAASFKGHFFGLLFFTPGILPSALRAGFAVRMRSCACVGRQRKVTRAAAADRNARCVPQGLASRRKRPGRGIATSGRESGFAVSTKNQ